MKRLLLMPLPLGLVACQGPSPATGSFGLDPTPAMLAAPQASDWTLQRVTARHLNAARERQFKTLAYPAVGGTWFQDLDGDNAPDQKEYGISLSTRGCSATDTMPNGAAAAYATIAGTSLYNKVFLVTREGKFIKIDRANPALYTTIDLDTMGLGNVTFSSTAVTMSPMAGRAYVLSDEGALFVVDTVTMTKLQALKPGPACEGIAPVLDPFQSNHQDLWDTVYFPDNNGDVWKYLFKKNKVAGTLDVTGPTKTVICSANPAKYAPLTGTRRVVAPAMVLNGLIMMGDTAGYFHVEDTNTPANSFEFTVGQPLLTAPAIELQDGSYSLTDPLGAPKAVPLNKPVFAFVTAGSACAWLNLHDLTVTTSKALLINDSDGSKYKSLIDYNYGGGKVTQFVTCEDGGSLNRESPQQNLHGRTKPWYNTHLTPASTNARAVAGAPGGGPIVSYARFKLAPTGGSLITRAELSLMAAEDTVSKVPNIHLGNPYHSGTTTPWVSSAMTIANMDGVSGPSIGSYKGGLTKAENVRYKADHQYKWDLSAAITSYPSNDYIALAIAMRPTDNKVYWPFGPYVNPVNNPNAIADPTTGAYFYNHTAASGPASKKKDEPRPRLQVDISTTSLPAPSIETSPVIDPFRRRVYVFYTNALYSLSYARPSAFEDSEYDVDTGLGTMYTIFNRSRLGIEKGCTFFGKKKFVGNTSNVVLNYNGSAAFALDRYPKPDNVEVPTAWRYKLSKFKLPLVATGGMNGDGQLWPNTPKLNDDVEIGDGFKPSPYLTIDPFSNLFSTGGNLYFGLGNGRIYQFDTQDL